MSLKDAAACDGTAATAYSEGLTKPSPPLAWQPLEALMSANIAAHNGADDEVPPKVFQPPNSAMNTVTAPVNSSACAATSGSSRHIAAFAEPGHGFSRPDFTARAACAVSTN